MINSMLFKALRNNSAQAISVLTDVRTFQRGREYFNEHRVISFEWDSRQDGRLVVLVRGSKVYRVTISLVKDALRLACDCPAWIMEQSCKHIICALLTAREELSPPPGDLVVDVPVSQPKKLSANMKNAQIITMHLEPIENALQLEVPTSAITFRRGFEKLEEYDFSPTSIEALLCASYRQRWDLEESLHKLFLTKKGTSYGITIHTEQGPLDVKWDSSGINGATTELDFADGVIKVYRRATRHDGSTIDEMLRISRGFFVDTKMRRLLYINILTSWPWVEYILSSSSMLLGNAAYRNMLSRSTGKFVDICQPIPISAEIFNEYYPIKYPIERYNPFNVAFVLKQEGVVAACKPQNPSLVVDGCVDVNNKSIELRLLSIVEGKEIDLWNDFCNSVREMESFLPSWLVTKKRWPLIIKTVLALVCAKNKQIADDLIKDLIVELKNTTTSPKGYVELKTSLANFYKIVESAACEMILVHDYKLQRIIFKQAELWSLAPLIASIFDVAYFNQNLQGGVSFTLPLEIFYSKLVQLRHFLNDHGVELRLNSKRLESVALDISINASGSQGNDWFDVAPHIIADGIALSEQQREVLFSHNGGMIETADCIKILDPQSQEILKILAHMFMQQGDGTIVKDKQSVVQIPRLRVLDLLELRQSGVHVTFSKDDEQLLSRLTNFTKIEKIDVPKKFSGTLRDYQKDGYRWLAFLYKNRFGACLADDMGLGKTIQVIAFLGGILEGILPNRSIPNRPHLIVVPPTLIFNWEHELAKFYPNLRVVVYSGMTQKQNFDNYDVVLTSYDRVRIDIDFFKEQQFHVLILDEAQAIKNIEAARTAAIRQLKSVFTISLTGTPLENHLGEYHSIIDVALPGLLPGYKDFMRSVQEGTHASFIKKTRPFVLRRTKESVLDNLPPKVESNVFLTMDTKQQKIYATTVAEVKRLIDQAFESKTAGQANIIALTAILRLRQICISPQMLDVTKESPSPKIDYLIGNLDNIVQEGNAALVFSQFTTCLDLVEDALKKSGLDYYRIDGKTTMAKRRNIIQSFQANDGGVGILLLSLKTGGVGLNLTRANYVFHIDPWWNPAVENQATDRSHRIGQKNSVFVTRLIMHHTIEEKMMMLKEVKQKLFSEIMEQAENKTKSIITKKDFDLLLS